MPPSAAYGLILNLAAIEMRDATTGQTTLICPDVPKLRIAIGVIRAAEKCSLYQQLHTYPVGNSGAEFKRRTHGAKYWIVPVRREVLVGLDCVIGVQSEDANLFERVRKGLRGELGVTRYGFPFAGDNNFLIDRIVEEKPPETTTWYARMRPEDPPRKGSCRLTVGIDRADNSKTTSFLYAPIESGSAIPPSVAWTWTPQEPLRIN
jgi:CRISPR-associated protein Cas5t